MNKPSPTDIARKIADTAARLGYALQVSGCTLTITKRFQPGSNDAFVECDMTYFEVLGLLPQTQSGSTWGTDGGGMGGAIALKSGNFRMNKSGGSKRVLAALKKLI